MTYLNHKLTIHQGRRGCCWWARVDGAAFRGDCIHPGGGRFAALLYAARVVRAITNNKTNLKR